MQSVPKEIQCDLQVTGGNQQKGMCRGSWTKEKGTVGLG